METNFLSTAPQPQAPTVGATITLDTAKSLAWQWSPAQDETINVVGPGLPGQLMLITLLTSGSTPYVISWNANFTIKSTVNTGAQNGAVLNYLFHSDGTQWRPVTAFNSNSPSGVSRVLRSEVTADVTNATATMANISDLSVVLEAGAIYVGEMVAKCSDSTAAEGIAFDFSGSAATATAFAAGAGLLTGGTTVASVTVSSALATDLVWTTITGETWLIIKIAITVNAGGTFIPRFCQGTAHSSGTATVSRGTYLALDKV